MIVGRHSRLLIAHHPIRTLDLNIKELIMVIFVVYFSQDAVIFYDVVCLFHRIYSLESQLLELRLAKFLSFLNIRSFFVLVLHVPTNDLKQFPKLSFFDFLSVDYGLRIKKVDSFTYSFEKLDATVGIYHPFDAIVLDVDFQGTDDLLEELGLIKFKPHIVQPVCLKLVVSQYRRENLPFHF